MGKIRRGRKIYHLQAAKKDDEDRESSSAADPKQREEEMPEELPVTFRPLANPDGAMFKNLKIDVEDLVQRLPVVEPKEPEVEPKEPVQPLPKMRKKEKMKFRRATFLNKIEAIVDAKKEAKARKKRQKTAVIGDLRPLTDALPAIDPPKTSKKRQRVTKLKPVKKFEARQAQMMKDILAFGQVRSHPSFQRDPEGTILDHLHNKLTEELA